MEDEKYVDESWKETVEDEKKKLDGKIEGLGKPEGSKGEEKSFERPAQELETDSQPGANAEGVEINFISYITSLAFQAMIFLGEIPNPVTNKTDKNLQQAKFIIDTLLLLREKTVNNLATQEADTLNAYLYELQMKYVESTK